MATRAKESAQVQRARRKLRKQLELEQQRVTASALQEVSRTIKKWLNRHADDRIDLSDKTITTFDSNRHPAATKSRYVQELLGQLKAQVSQDKTPKSLEGRIKEGRVQPADEEA